MNEDRWKIDWYQNWLEREEVPLVSGFAIDLTTVETAYWPRLGADAAIVHLDARGDYCNLYLVDVAPAGNSAPIRHMYEHLVYVLDGRGSTVIETASGKREFEWARGSLFSIPLNVRYQHFNSSGQNRARLVNISSMPFILNLFRNEDFIFNSSYEFAERMGEDRLFNGEGNFIETREHRHQWETNLVPDLLSFTELRESPGRGAGSTNIQFALADCTLHAHASDIPVGNYKKAHYHGEGYHIMQLSGVGYSLYWNDGETPTRFDWEYGLLHSPRDGMWHQHFNVSDVPARYMAASFGSIRYPMLRQKHETLERDYRKGGRFQIEYADEDPEIRRVFEAECAKFAARKKTGEGRS
jgi:quercetin dioxygenase-like cupin family protein